MPGTWNPQRNDRGPAPRPAPEPTGQLIASFERPGYRGSPAGEIRVSVDKFNGHPYLSLRLWESGQDGEFRPTRKGLSVRLNEAEGVVAALVDGLELAGGLRGQRGRERDRGETSRLQPEASRFRTAPIRATVAPQRALPSPAPEPAMTFSNDFDEFREA